MLTYPSIKPYIIKIGSLQIRWYGLMYLLGLASSYFLAQREVKRLQLKIDSDDIENLYFYIFLGMIIGARLGYILFYNLSFYLTNPLEVFETWHGGMSFHGGLVGGVTFGIYYCIKRHIDYIKLLDILIPTVPLTLAFGRVGNFINGELYGRPTEVPWAMVFPDAGLMGRHPSQIYEFLLEGVLLFIILWTAKGRLKTKGASLPLFLTLYGCFRIIAEFFREPDPQVGFFFGIITMGQILSLSMIIAGAIIYRILRKMN
ncbi:MAG: prolipoprotein diacylglyceryl transferase [Nitrospirae bacterium]|nr:prolipoprotein diacylglyceryl transferase [Nitrospirota bacterium]MBF0540236.1 prolipoprotein diacylglyceryl transferase [Nitrospirota bacterium]